MTNVPVKKRDATASFNAIYQHAGTDNIKYARIDDARELKKALKAHRIPFTTSAPYVHVNNGLAETYVRIALQGGRVNMEQCGAPPTFWPYAIIHYGFARNIQRVIEDALSPYEERFGENSFDGLRIPFFAYVHFMQLDPIRKGKEIAKVSSALVPGVFLGWAQNPGGQV